MQPGAGIGSQQDGLTPWISDVRVRTYLESGNGGGAIAFPVIVNIALPTGFEVGSESYADQAEFVRCAYQTRNIEKRLREQCPIPHYENMATFFGHEKPPAPIPRVGNISDCARNVSHLIQGNKRPIHGC